MERKTVNVMGMELEQWTHKSCSARFGVGEDWATLFTIESSEEGKGHATELLKEAKGQYEKEGKKVGGSVALNDGMSRIYEKLGIEEYLD